MLLLASAIILFVVVYQKRMLNQQLQLKAIEADKQKELLQATINAQDSERRRIAKDLHDELGASLSAVKLGINALLKRAEGLQEATSIGLETKGVLDGAITSVRQISKQLLPATLEEFGLQAALKELCNKLSVAGEVQVKWQSNQTAARVDTTTELALYRVVQELVNNALKHASATEITVSLNYTEVLLSLIVQDNGRGFDKKVLEEMGADKGLGLRNIESRLSTIAATMNYLTSPGKGTRVEIDLQLLNTT